jgi:ABC-type sugar transport system substrate-binding protein
MAVALAGLVLGPGCDSASFMPPPPPELTEATGVGTGPLAGPAPAPATGSPALAARKDVTKAALGSAKIVELILARAPDPDRIYLEQALRRETGKARIVFRIVEPKSAETEKDQVQPRPFPAARVAEAIRGAIGHGISGLIVEPVDDPAVVDALYQARGRGVSVLTLDRAVPPRGGQTIPFVRYTSFAVPGRELVQAALEASKLLGTPQIGRILVLHRRVADPYADERLKSLVDPLKAAGKPFEQVEFEGDHEAGIVALRKALDADPKVAIILADDGQGMAACVRTLSQWKASNHPAFLFAGYLAYDYRSASDLITQGVAFADPSVETYATQAFQAMHSLLEGKPVGERIEVPIVVRRKSTLFVPASTQGEAQPGPKPSGPTSLRPPPSGD